MGNKDRLGPLRLRHAVRLDAAYVTNFLKPVPRWQVKRGVDFSSAFALAREPPHPSNVPARSHDHGLRVEFGSNSTTLIETISASAAKNAASRKVSVDRNALAARPAGRIRPGTQKFRTGLR